MFGLENENETSPGAVAVGRATRLGLISGLITLTAVPVGHAQQNLELEEVVVTATRFPTDARKVGSAVSVITAEDIEREQLTSIDEVLDRLPGVNLRSRTPGFNTGINVRGLGPRNTLILVDGVEVADPSEAQVQFTLRNQIDVDSIERIEVLRGPQSGVYGADSSGGVINVITKRPTRPFGARASVEGGKGALTSARANAAIEAFHGPIDVRISAFYSHQDNISTASNGDEDDTQGAEGGQVRVGYDVTETLRLEGDFKAVQINQHYDTTFPLNGVFSTTEDSGGSNVTKLEMFGNVGAELGLFNGRLQNELRYGFSRHERKFAYVTPTPIDFDSYDGTKHRLDYLGRLEIAEDHSLILGAESEFTRLDQVTPNVSPTLQQLTEETRNDGFSLGYLGSYAGATASVSGRLDSHKDYGEELTYRGSLSYLFEDIGTKLRGSYGTGFVAPSLYERFDPCIGNDEIEPERSRGFDFGVDQELLDGDLSFSATFFRTKVEDQIDFTSLGTAQDPGCTFAGIYRNVDETRSRGVEVEFAANLPYDISISGSWTLTDAKDEVTDRRLRDVPRNRASADVTWRFLEGATVGLGVNYRGNVETFNDTGSNDDDGDNIGDEFTIFSVRGSYEILDAKDGPGLTVFGRVENMFDAHYEEQPGYTTPGIVGYLGLRAKY